MATDIPCMYEEDMYEDMKDMNNTANMQNTFHTCMTSVARHSPSVYMLTIWK